MRDEMDGRIWNDHHHGFSLSVEQGIAAARRATGSLTIPVDGPRQLVSAIAAVLLSLSTLGGTIA